MNLGTFVVDTIRFGILTPSKLMHGTIAIWNSDAVESFEYLLTEALIVVGEYTYVVNNLGTTNGKLTEADGSPYTPTLD